MFTIVLFEPQIPQNTGNIVRTCAVTGCNLVLVEPLGFQITNRHLKRAGLDYWEGVSVSVIDNLDAYLKKCREPFFFFSSKGEILQSKISFIPPAHLIFGSETEGLPSRFFQKWPDRFLRIPMKEGGGRCLNLATAAGIAVYEAMRNSW